MIFNYVKDSKNVLVLFNTIYRIIYYPVISLTFLWPRVKQDWIVFQDIISNIYHLNFLDVYHVQVLYP